MGVRRKGSGHSRIRHTPLSSSRASAFKRQTFYALENVRAAKPLAKLVGYGLFVLIVLNAIIVFVSAEPSLNPLASNVMEAFFAFSTVCFFLEYLARIWIADLAYGDCTPAQARRRYVTSLMGVVDLLAWLPGMIAWFVPMTHTLRAIINLVRLVRLVKVSRYMRGLRTIARVLRNRKHEIVASFMVIVLLTIVASVLMYEAEHDAQPDKFNSLFTGLYWGFTTVSGTGYGDLVPITSTGRFIGSIIMLLSVALVAIPGGIFSAGFVTEYQNANVRKIERHLSKEARAEQAREEQREREHTSILEAVRDGGLKEGAEALVGDAAAVVGVGSGVEDSSADDVDAGDPDASADDADAGDLDASADDPDSLDATSPVKGESVANDPSQTG